MKALIMDLDGTLCDGSGYLGLGDHAYHEAATTVAPVRAEMVDVMTEALERNVFTVILTGRSELWQSAGGVWLERHGLSHCVVEFLSRSRGDWRPNAAVKREALLEIRSYGYDVVAAYDDDPRNCAMFRTEGVPGVVQVGTFDRRLA